jgi:hypothetical protein
MKWTVDVQQTEDGDCFIQFNEEILEASGFKEGDSIKWVDNLDGSFTIMNADTMDGYVLSSELFNDKTDRFAKVYKSLGETIDYVIDMYENDALMVSRKIVQHTEDYAEDCVKNWVMCYGEFAKK